MSKFILFSADPNAWRGLRDQTFSDSLDQSKRKPSLAELLSLAALGYQDGLTWNKSFMPVNSHTLCQKAWHSGFYQGFTENPGDGGSRCMEQQTVDEPEIKTDADYDAALAEVKRLWLAPAGSAEAGKLDRIAMSMHRFEREREPLPLSESCITITSIAEVMVLLDAKTITQNQFNAVKAWFSQPHQDIPVRTFTQLMAALQRKLIKD